MVLKRSKRKTKKEKEKIAFRKKVFIIAAVTTLVVSLIIFSILTSGPQTVEILYFSNEKCPIDATTDEIIADAIAEFGDKIIVKTYEAKLYDYQPEDPEEIKQLREKYNVIGLPTIIINGKKFTKQFTKNNLFSEICNNFIVKPANCIL